MESEFCWIAKLFIDGKLKETRYFATESERDDYVNEHLGWKKRGKICSDNLENHLKSEYNSFFEAER